MGGLFSGPKAAQPVVSAPATMPDDMSPGVLEARRKATMDTTNRASRANTILSKPAKSGSTNRDYSSMNLG